MIPYVLSELFFKIFAEINIKDPNYNLKFDGNTEKLETALRNFLIKTIGYKNSYVENFKEVEILFENIIKNSYRYKMNILDIIESYGDDFVSMLNNHPYTKSFIESVNSLYSAKFDIKRGDNSLTDGFNTGIRHIDKKLELMRLQRINEEAMPSMRIINIDSFEEVLSKYIENIKNSDTYYNIFYRDAFSEKSEEEKLKMIFEGTLLNVTHHDAQNIELFFQNYSDFVSDNSFDSIRTPIKIGTLFDDELYVMAKRSELWYETPYYLSFMLRNNKLELPNVRIGISKKGNKKVAQIIATQTSQVVFDREKFDELQKTIKLNIPADNYFRFYNPSHVVPLIITFGMLKGMGIEDVIIKDYMPFRYKKVINDKQLNEEEAENYQTRLTTKNIATYMRIIANVDGIELVSYPDVDSELQLKIEDVVKGKNEFLDNLYNTGLEYGKSIQLEDNYITDRKY